MRDGPMAPDHALIVACGVLDHTTVTQLDTCGAAVPDTGARYLVLDLAQVSRRDPAALAALAAAARRLSLRQGWLRLVATSPAVIAALGSTDICDLADLNHAHHGTGMRPDPHCAGHHRAAQASRTDRPGTRGARPEKTRNSAPSGHHRAPPPISRRRAPAPRGATGTIWLGCRRESIHGCPRGPRSSSCRPRR